MDKNIFDDIDVDAIINPPPKLSEEVNIFDSIDLDAFFLTPEEIEKKEVKRIQQDLTKVDLNTVKSEVNQLKGKDFLQVGDSAATTPFAAFMGKGIKYDLKESEKFNNILNDVERKRAYVKQHPYMASLASGLERLVPGALQFVQDMSDVVHNKEDLDRFINSKDPKTQQAGMLVRSLQHAMDPTSKLDLNKTIKMMSDQIEQFSVTQEGDEKGVTGLWEEGNYKQALDLGYRQALQSAPLSTSLEISSCVEAFAF